MLAFLKLQLKLYFRHKSSYIVPLILGLFFIAIRGALYLAIKNTNEVANIFNSSFLSRNLSAFALFTTYVIGTFTGMTIFFKYRQEGLELISFSKPISRTKIYFANIFATFIGSFFSLLVCLMGNFISIAIIPQLTVWFAFSSTLAMGIAIALGLIFIIGISAIVQLFVEVKLFQILIGVIPFFISMIFSIIYQPLVSDNIKIYDSMRNRLVVPLGKDISKMNRQVDRLKNELNNDFDVLLTNKTAYQYFETYNNEPNYTTQIEAINEYNNSFYRKIYWLNYSEYFYRTFILFNNDIISDYKKPTYTKLDVIKDGEINSYLEKFAINSDQNIYFKVHDEKTNIENYVLLGYNLNKFINLFNNYNTNASENSGVIGNRYLNYTSSLSSTEKNLNNLKLINLLLWGKLLGFDRKLFLTNIENNSLGVYDVEKDYKTASLEKIKQYLTNIGNDEQVMGFVQELVEQIAQNIQPKIDELASVSERYAYNEMMKKFGEFKEKLTLMLKNTVLTSLTGLQISEEKLVVEWTELNDLANKDVENLNLHDKNFVTFYVMQNNLIEFSRTDGFNIYVAILTPIIIGLLAIIAGWAISLKKDYK